MKRLLFTVFLTLFAIESSYPQDRQNFLSDQKITSLAVLPPIGESVPGSAREMAADLFLTKLKQHTSLIQTVRPEQAVERFEKDNLIGTLAELLVLLKQTGTPNKDAIMKLGESAKTSGVLLITVLDYDEQRGSWWYGRGGKNFCRIQYTLFRSTDGQKIWESLEFRQHDSKLSTRPYPMERVLGDVSEKAVLSILSGTQNLDVRRKK